jgi:hypothetical protein
MPQHLNNGRFFGVPRVAVVDRFDCNIISKLPKNQLRLRIIFKKEMTTKELPGSPLFLVLL